MSVKDVSERRVLSMDERFDSAGIPEFKCEAKIKKSSVVVKGPSDLAGYLDHSALKPILSDSQVRTLCEEVVEYGFRGICVNPAHVSMAKEILRGTEGLVISVCGFPLGMNLTATKVAEAVEAIRSGADEIDMVMQIGFLKSKKYREVFDDIRAVVEASGAVPVKVILETCLLDEDEKIAASLLAKRAGAAFLKTSTGFSDSGATEEDIRLMKMIAGDDMGVKAAGGVRDFQKACRMIDAGADCIGATASIKMVTIE